MESKSLSSGPHDVEHELPTHVRVPLTLGEWLWLIFGFVIAAIILLGTLGIVAVLGHFAYRLVTGRL